MMLKSHMQSPVPSSNRTRCGKLKGDIGNFYPIVLKYGSSDATCKMCQRLYAQDLSDTSKDSSDSAKVSELDMRERGAFRELLRGDDS